MKLKLTLLLSVLLVLQSCQNDDLETQTFDSPLNQKEIVVHLENNIAIRWTNLFLELERYANGMRPNASARAIAYINMAAYETGIPGMKKCITNENRLSGFQISDYDQSLDIDYEVALNACYAKSLNYFLLNLPSGMKSRITNLETTIAIELQSRLSSQKISASRNWGLFVANRVINYSNTDTDAMAQILDPQPLSYIPPSGIGMWDFYAEEERALFPYWESVRTFVISPNETTSIAPKVYNETVGSAYYNEMIEVRNENNAAKSGNTEQLWIAQFWSDDLVGMTFSPPARQISIANQLAIQNDLNLEEVLNLYVKTGFALNDAAVSCWKYKYQYNVMRPNVYIREHIESDFQTNLYTMIDWPNPSFPGYPSGHSTFASAAGGVFKNTFGNNIQLLDRSHENRTEFLGAPRSFTTVDQLVNENAFSRVPLGVHMRMDCEEGVRLGYEISNAVNHLRMTRN